MSATRFLVSVVAILTLSFLVVPIVILVPMSFSSANSLEFPPPGLSLRWYVEFIQSEAWASALGTSLLVAFLSSCLAVVVGSVASYELRKTTAWSGRLLEGNLIAPMVIPSIITAIAFYLCLARIGLLGSLVGIVLAHTILNVPYVVIVMASAFKAFDFRLEQVAWTMGASWTTTMRRIVLPLMYPYLCSAWIFAFVGSFDEVVVTSFIAGSYVTIPKQMFSELSFEITPTVTAVATMLIALTVVSLGAAGLLVRRTVRP